jgi:hypothetical protein
LPRAQPRTKRSHFLYRQTQALRAIGAIRRNNRPPFPIVPDDSQQGCSTIMEMKMKKLIVALAAVAAFVSAAAAHPMHGARMDRDMRAAAAQAMEPSYTGAANAYGRNLGADPDPQVRLQLLRNAGFADR